MKQSGFSLLEAIIALVIVATVGISLFSWVNTNIMSLGRVQAAQQRNAAIQSGLAFADTINPMDKPQGQEVLDNYVFNWQSTLIEPVKPGRDQLGGPGFYELGLYDVEMTILEAGLEVARFNVRQVGYKQVRKPSY